MKNVFGFVFSEEIFQRCGNIFTLQEYIPVGMGGGGVGASQKKFWGKKFEKKQKKNLETPKNWRPPKIGEPPENWRPFPKNWRPPEKLETPPKNWRTPPKKLETPQNWRHPPWKIGDPPKKIGE